ncbi:MULTISPECIES: glycoside hydrolase family 16 protein [unclassified Bradyrhizobium]|uniref:glycoside hydrolase family 16 protein n=1 Tax=unclassified Bradyrhizobium TaxID=2631580 RepID=UPI001CD1B3BC|nr:MULTISPECIES: glycoside hydrolase family 16 protein [unclassified Bradyrhizobium]MCA1426782.1 glycoside hydrolase family 16 protein [Bradyrhizobium sp. NBAIM16]MCA1505569.1 glycoside hydrolase family 16 protein [Bradyrhizobium sp. NBAIM02]
MAVVSYCCIASLERTARILSSILILVSLTIGPATAGGWKLVFSDEFSANALDREKWATRYIYENETLDHFKDEVQRYRDSHLLADGVLSLIAKKGNSGHFDSGMIRTHQTFYYGYFEARVFLPKGKGIWPAFWLLGDYDRDGKTWHPPEIDIFEYVINEVEDQDTMLHSGAQDKAPASVFTFVDTSFNARRHQMHADAPLNAGWHTAGLVWTPDRIAFFWDGRLIYSRPYRWLRPDGLLGPPAQVILNFAIGGAGWAGRYGIDESAFPQSFKIDYVHVCQFTSSNEGSRLCGGSEATPDPAQFSYEADHGDMPKPTFLPTLASRARDSSGAVLLPHDSPTELEVPMKLPDDTWRDETIRILLLDETTNARTTLYARTARQLGPPGVDGTIKILLSIPTLPQRGDFILLAEISSKGRETQGWHVPLACDTGVKQPIKSRSCRLLILRRR